MIYYLLLLLSAHFVFIWLVPRKVRSKLELTLGTFLQQSALSCSNRDDISHRHPRICRVTRGQRKLRCDCPTAPHHSSNQTTSTADGGRKTKSHVGATLKGRKARQPMTRKAPKMPVWNNNTQKVARPLDKIWQSFTAIDCDQSTITVTSERGGGSTSIRCGVNSVPLIPNRSSSLWLRLQVGMRRITRTQFLSCSTRARFYLSTEYAFHPLQRCVLLDVEAYGPGTYINFTVPWSHCTLPILFF